MSNKIPFSISISRQVGSGGGILGKNLSEKLNALFMDREIVMQTAKKLGITYEDMESLDERTTSFWKAFLYSCQCSDCYYTPAEYFPSDRAIHDAEAEIVLNAARRESIVVVGRGANFVLKDEPNHLSIFLHAGLDFRKKRIERLFNVTEPQALKLIQETDLARENYIHKFTGENVYDLKHYNLVIDTGVLDLEAAEELILNYIRLRFGNVAGV